MKTKLFSAFVLLFMSITANAYDVEVDGVYYDINLSDLTAKVTCELTEDYKPTYKGKLVIPACFTYNSQTFTVTGIDKEAFYSCDSLTSVSLPNTIQELPDLTFSMCFMLSKVVLPAKIKKIPNGCFLGCTSLENITIPESVTVIDPAAFTGCTSLGPELKIKPNIQQIGNNSYANCTGVRRLIIEDSNDSLVCGEDTKEPFLGDNLDYFYVGRPLDFNFTGSAINVLELGAGLTSNAIPKRNVTSYIISDIEEPTLFDPQFSYITYLTIPLYVPVGKVDAYRHAEGWKNFVYIYENHGEVNKIDNVTAAKKAGATMYYNLSGQAVAKDYKGVVIERYSDGTSKKVLNK